MIVEQRQDGVARSDLSERRGGVGAQSRPARQSDLHALVARRRTIDKFGLAESRRARDHDRRDFRLIVRERRHDVTRRVRGAGERLGEGAARQHRRIVEQSRKADRRLAALVLRQTAIAIGPRQGASRVGALAWIGGLRGAQEPAHHAPRRAGGAIKRDVRLDLAGGDQVRAGMVRRGEGTVHASSLPTYGKCPLNPPLKSRSWRIR